MAPLLLSLLLGLLLDQADRGQRLAQALAAAPRPGGGGALLLLAGAILPSAALLAWSGAWLGATMPPRARLLFFGLALLFGGVGMLLVRRGVSAQASDTGLVVLLPRLLLTRLTGRAPFALFAVALLTQAPVLAAIGGAAGGFAALLPPFFAGPAYARAFPLLALARVAGALLLVAGAVCGLSALALV